MSTSQSAVMLGG